MPPHSFEGLLGVALIAFGAPLLLGLAPRLRVPAVVLEIVAGIVVGPSVLGWIRVDLPIAVLSTLGLTFLLFPGWNGGRLRPPAGPSTATGRCRAASLVRHGGSGRLREPVSGAGALAPLSGDHPGRDLPRPGAAGAQGRRPYRWSVRSDGDRVRLPGRLWRGHTS